MRTRARLSLVVGLAITVVLGAQGQSPSTASKTEGVSSPPPYRLLQLVSVGRTAEKINEAAAAGYRFLMLQPTPGAAGVTVLMKRVEDSTAAYQYKFVVSEPGKDRLHRALNQAASGGFRLVADSLLFGPAQPRDGELLLWPAGAEKKQYSQTYVAVMEKAPGTSASYEYRVSSALRLSATKKDLREISSQGFTPVSSAIELSPNTTINLLMASSTSLPHFVLVFEKIHSDAAAARPRTEYAYAQLGSLRSGDGAPGAITIDFAPATTPAPHPQQEREGQAEPSETQDTPDADNATPEDAFDKLRSQAAALAGYRLLFLTHFTYSESIWLLAEKKPGPVAPSYRLVLCDAGGLEQLLNNQARQGFRLFPGGVVDTARKFDFGHGEIHDFKSHLPGLALLQRDPTAGQYQYRVLRADDAVDLLKQVNDAAAQGYGFAGMWGTNVVMEKASADSPAAGGGL